MAVFIGGGIVTLPNAFYTTGLIAGEAIMICVGILTVNRAWLYMKAKDFIPGKPESMYEIGYYLFGRPIIFMISFMLCLLNFGTIIGLLKIFGGICGSLIIDFFPDIVDSGWKWLTYDSFWMIGLCVAISPVCLKKEIEELYIVTVLLFMAIMSFFGVLFVQFVVFGRSEFSRGEPLTIGNIWTPKTSDNVFLDMVPPLTLMIFCFAFTSNLFPIYSALRDKTNENGLKVFGIATCLAIFTFSGVSMLGIMIFGKNVTLNAGNLISNINEEVRHNESGKGHWEAFLLRALYFVIIVTHVPPIFFPGKEAVLIMIDEIDRRSISNTLEERIKQLKLKEANESYDEDELDGSMKDEIEVAGRVSASGT